MARHDDRRARPSQATPTQHHGHRPGVFVPQYVIATAACIFTGIGASLLVWFVPSLRPPLGVGVAVAGLALTMYELRRGRGRG